MRTCCDYDIDPLGIQFHASDLSFWDASPFEVPRLKRIEQTKLAG